MNFIFMLTHNDRPCPTPPMSTRACGARRCTTSASRTSGPPPRSSPSWPRRPTPTGSRSCSSRVDVARIRARPRSRRPATIGVDWVMGGTHADDGVRILAGSGIKYCPFPGRIEGHPSVLLGSVAEIAKDARELTALDGVFGLDLLAYRTPTEDPLALTRDVVAASAGPVIVAGSIATAEQIRLVAASRRLGIHHRRRHLRGAPARRARPRRLRSLRSSPSWRVPRQSVTDGVAGQQEVSPHAARPRARRAARATCSPTSTSPATSSPTKTSSPRASRSAGRRSARPCGGS